MKGGEVMYVNKIDKLRHRERVFYQNSRTHSANSIIQWWMQIRAECSFFWPKDHQFGNVPHNLVGRAVDRFLDDYLSRVAEDESVNKFTRDHPAVEFAIYVREHPDFEDMVLEEVKKYEREKEDIARQVRETVAKLDPNDEDEYAYAPQHYFEDSENNFVHRVHLENGWECDLCNPTLGS